MGNIKQFLSSDKFFRFLGFSLAGGLWGLQYFIGSETWRSAVPSPFEYILAAIFFGLIAAIFHPGGKKSFIKNILDFLAHILIWLAAFLIPQLFVSWSFMISRTYKILFRIINIPDYLSEKFLNLDKANVGDLWFQFVLAGMILGLAYSWMDKKNIAKRALQTAAILGGASFLAPLIGNMFSMTFSSRLAGFIATFTIIGFYASYVFDQKADANQ